MMTRFSRPFPLFLLFLLGVTAGAGAQPINSGSIYSRLGLGERESFGSSSAMALGGAATALPFFDYVSLSNPATFSTLFSTRFSAGARLQTLRAEDASGSTSLLTNGTLNGISFAFPLLRNRFGVGVGTEAYTRVAYRVRTSGTIPAEGDEPETAYELNLLGSGGLQRFVGGAGYAFSEQLRAGLAVHLLHGIIEYSQETSFPEQTNFLTTQITEATRLTGVTAQAGLYYQQGPAPGESGPRFAAGATFTLPASLSGERIRTIGRSLDRDTLSVSGSGSVRLPLETTLGVAYAPNGSWTLALEGRYEPWRMFESDFDFSDTEISDRWRIGGGAQYTPASTGFSNSYFSRVAYRLGLYVDKGYASPTTNVDIHTYALTGGLSLPTLFPSTRFDLNVELGTRGTTDHNLVRDLFYRLSLTLNFGELWFVKQRLE